MKNEMFEFLNQGCSRKVYAINDDVVIKVARYLTSDGYNSTTQAKWGIEQCQVELQTYLKYGDKMPLCKIFVDMCTDERIVMERVTPLSSLPPDVTEFDYITDLVSLLEFEREDKEYLDSLSPTMRRFADKILQSGLTRSEIRDILVDVEYSNIGLKDGELVILDYGLVG